MATTRRQLLKGIAAGPLFQVPSRAQNRTKTNGVFFLTDDHGAWAMGHECPEMHTPNLDALGETGVRFSRSYAATPVCSPSRMTYLTGRLPSHHGVQDFLLPQDRWGESRQRFLKDQPTFTEVLAQNGYTVGLSGKWHMGDNDTPHAGFSYWCTKVKGSNRYKDPIFLANGKRTQHNGHTTDIVGDYGLEFIDRNKDNPFCLYVPFFAPHSPYDYQPERDRKWYANSEFSCFPRIGKHPQRRIRFEQHHGNRETMTSYSALVTGVDHNVGRIMRRLDELGLRENTLIVFTADQGWNAGHHGVWGKGNATIPFNMYEESIRVPAIWNHPGSIEGGKVLSPMVSSYDFFPTMLDYLNVPAPEDPKRIGQSYVPFLRGQSPSWRNELYFEYGYVRSVRTENLKYIERADNWPIEMFDLEADPGETVNVAGARAYQEQVATLRSRLRREFSRIGAPPIGRWRSTTTQTIPTDTEYYGRWMERKP